MAVSDYLNELVTPQNVTNLAASVLGLNAGRGASGALQSAYAPNSYDQMYQQLAQQLQGLTGQIADTNNPQFQSRVNARRDEIMRQYENQLRQQQAVEARRYGRTGMGMVNPERRDEAIARSLAAFRSQAEAQARAEAMNELVQAAKTTGTVAAPVANIGSQSQRAREVAGANVGNAYDAARKTNYLQLAGSVLGPLLKGIDFKKLGGVFENTQPTQGSVQGPTVGAGAPAFDAAAFNMPEFGNDFSGSFDPGYGYAGPGAGPQAGAEALNLPTFDMGAFPAAGGDAAGMFDPGYGYAAPSFEMPTFGGDTAGTFDPGYGYAAPQFDASTFDFPSGGFDFGGMFDPGFGY